MKNIVCLVLLIFAFSCKKTANPIPIKNLEFLQFSENILDYRITPKDSVDRSGLIFSDQERVDLYAKNLFLSRLAIELKLISDSNQFTPESAYLKAKNQRQFYDEEDGWFYDTNLNGIDFIKGEGLHAQNFS